MPRLGFGVALSADAVQSVSTALEVGYRQVTSFIRLAGLALRLTLIIRTCPVGT